MNCLFCRIAQRGEPAWLFWEDDRHIAFLTPFPNTKGFTVVATKAHLPSYLFQLTRDEYDALFWAARKVGLTLDRALGTARTGLIAEGMGIDHAHLKLSPMHGIAGRAWRPVKSTERRFYTEYIGYIASHDGPRADDGELERLSQVLRTAARE